MRASALGLLDGDARAQRDLELLGEDLAVDDRPLLEPIVATSARAWMTWPSLASIRPWWC